MWKIQSCRLFGLGNGSWPSSVWYGAHGYAPRILSLSFFLSLFLFLSLSFSLSLPPSRARALSLSDRCNDDTTNTVTTLKAVPAGKTVDVSIDLTADELAFHDDAMKLRVVQGNYTVSVGGDSFTDWENHAEMLLV
jgi:hypothetical protein